MDTVNIMIVAGEASGDAHAAKLVEAIRRSAPERTFHFFGSAGPAMRAAGVEPVVHADELAIMGLTEIARALPMFLSAFRKLKSSAADRRTDAVILVDFPEFNLKLARSLKRRGLRVIYYISPQLWGWRKYRRRTIAKHVDLLLTILPFEKDWYREQGIHNVEYVGNPLANEVHPTIGKDEFCTRHGLDPARPIIALLPGSRRKELTRILPPMLKGVTFLSTEKRELQFVLALASTRTLSEAEERIAEARSLDDRLPEIKIVQGETYDALNAAAVAAVASGTATLEAGIIGTPMAIVYKASGFNYRIVRPLIKVEHFGLINLIAGERIMAEMIQNDFTPRRLAEELTRLLEPDTNSAARAALRNAAGKLGPGGASARAATAVLELLGIR